MWNQAQGIGVAWTLSLGSAVEQEKCLPKLLVIFVCLIIYSCVGVFPSIFFHMLGVQFGVTHLTWSTPFQLDWLARSPQDWPAFVAFTGVIDLYIMHLSLTWLLGTSTLYWCRKHYTHQIIHTSSLVAIIIIFKIKFSVCVCACVHACVSVGMCVQRCVYKGQETVFESLFFL